LGFLNKLKSRLTKGVSGIDNIIDEEPEILAKISLPLKVDNAPVANFIYSSVISGLKLSLRGGEGLLMDGDTQEYQARVFNMGNHRPKFPAFVHDKSDKKWNNSEGDLFLRLSVGETDILRDEQISLEFGESFEHNFNIGPVRDNRSQAIRFEIKESNHFFKKFKKSAGYLSYNLDVLPDEIAPIFAINSPLNNNFFIKSDQETAIEIKIEDPFGKVDQSSLSLKLNDQDIPFILTELNKDISFMLNANLKNLEDGQYQVSATGKDLGGNQAIPASFSFVVDSVAPVLAADQESNQLTNNPNFQVNLTVDDFSPTQTFIFVNDVLVSQVSDKIISFSTTLPEGVNSISFKSVDASSNLSEELRIENITVDLTPPQLSQISPDEGEVLNSLKVLVKAISNEELSQVQMNGNNITLSNDKKSFQADVFAQIEGPFLIEIKAVDLAGNQASLRKNVEIFLKVINKKLISIIPDSNLNKIRIIGAPNAARAGAEVEVDGGLFNSKTVIANADGSFEVLLDPTELVKIEGTSSDGRSDSAELAFNADTTLSGLVLDDKKMPLPGVTVRIKGTSHSTSTDASGAFQIPDPSTGDQTLEFDGSTIPVAVTGPNRKFSAVSISVSLGSLQQNVLERPTYLTPLMFDGTETSIPDQNTPVTVTSPHAPGVRLEIPAGVTNFPDGSKVGTINAIEIPIEVSSLKPLDFARPQSVIALEPSGLTFDEPVELTLPNINNYPPGIQVVILSKNSTKGIWEIDGLARVSDDGTEMTTEENSGITHFSEVYSVPLGPKVAPFSSKDRPGADTFNGALTTSISLPSYKALGQNIAPGMVYNSTWASPNIVVSNLFDVPRQEFHFKDSSGARSLFGSGNVSVAGKAWIEPDFIDVQFFSENIRTDKMRYTGLPNKSIVSYAMDLSSLESGIHPYTSKYELHLKQMILGTRTIQTKKLFGRTRISQSRFAETRAIEQVFPSDVSGPLIINNESNSNNGAGWRLSGNSRLHSINGPRIVVNSVAGDVVYTQDSTISSVYEQSSSLDAVNFFNYPEIEVTNSGKVIKYDIENKTAVENISIPTSFHPTYPAIWQLSHNPNAGSERVNCRVTMTGPHLGRGKARTPRHTLGVGDSMFVVDKDGVIYDAYSKKQILGSTQKTPPYFLRGDQFGTQGLQLRYGMTTINRECPRVISGTWFENQLALMEDTNFNYRGLCDTRFCLDNLGPHCQEINYPRGFISVSKPLPFGTVLSQKEAAEECIRSSGFSSSGDVASPGFKNGSLSESKLNSPSFILHLENQKILVADTGNNRVRLADLDSGVINTFAGNGQTYDNGDGRPSAQASLFHPRGLAKDSLGNIYVSTERGLIRKINSEGVISTFAGKIASQGGVFSDNAPAEEMLFSSPYGMAVDNIGGFLYVADTGHHRVIRIDLVTKMASTVAGSGACVSSNAAVAIGDGGVALSASLCNPEFVGLDDNQDLLIADTGHKKIRHVSFSASSNGELSFVPPVNDGSRIKKNSDGTFTRFFRNGSEDQFDPLGKQVGSVDKIGREVLFEYDTNGNLITFTDPTGSSTSYFYDSGKLSRIVDTAGRETFFDISNGLLNSVTYPDGSSQSFNYDQNGLLLSESNQRGIVSEYSYNEWNRLVSVKKSDNSVIQINDLQSSSVGNSYTGGSIGTLKTQGEGNVIDGIINAKGQETIFNKDETGYIIKVTDALGRETLLERDSEGRPLKVTRPDGTYSSFSYDSITGDLLTKYDSLSNITLTYVYNKYGSLVEQTDVRGNKITRALDSETNQLLSQTNQLGQSSSYEYNSLGLVSKVTNHLGNASQFFYDQYGNLIRSIDPQGNESLLIRDIAGNVLESKNANDQIKVQEYDHFNRLLSVTTAKGEKTSYSYLLTGELEQIIDPGLKLTSFSYDDLGQLVSKIDQLGRETKLKYDKNGNVTEETDPLGNIKQFEYDEIDQLVKTTLPDDIIEMDYDVSGNLTLLKNNVSEIDYTYTRNQSGFLVDSERITGLNALTSFGSHYTTYDYDPSGNRVEMINASGTTTYSYDDLNRLTSLTNGKGSVFEFDYDNVNRLTQITRPGSITQFAFDNSNFLENIIHTKRSDSSNIWDIAYSRDGIGNRTQMRTPAGAHDYVYDLNNQLTSASAPLQATETFNYDSYGNRTQDNKGTYSYDNTKQLLEEDHSFFYAYDNNGNLTSKISKADNSDVENYIYNSQNRMIGYENYIDGVLTKSANYYYDALGRRMRKEVEDHQNSSSNHIRDFLYDGHEVIAQTDGNSNTLAHYTHSTLGTDDMLAVEFTSDGVTAGVSKQQGEFYYVKDGLGSVVAIADVSGQLVQQYRYSSFGELLEVLDGSGTNTKADPQIKVYFAYTGRESDSESGLYYYRARAYDAIVGRFLQVDPDSGAALSPLTVINKYIYSLNDPVNRLDPSGKFSLKGFAEVIGGSLLGFATLGGVGSYGGSVTSVNLSDEFSENEKVRITKTAAVVALAGLAVATGGITAQAAGVSYSAIPTIGITAGTSAFSASVQTGNFVDNFLNNAIIGYGAAAAFNVLNYTIVGNVGAANYRADYGPKGFFPVNDVIATLGLVNIYLTARDPENNGVYKKRGKVAACIGGMLVPLSGFSGACF
jgi:RHS repeat-associated protein